MRSQGHNYLGGLGFSVPHPTDASLGRERVWWVPWALPGRDRVSSQEQQPNPRCTLTLCNQPS